VRLLASSPLPLRHRARVRVHIGTQELIASARLIGTTTLEAGQSGFAQFFCAEPGVTYALEPLVIRAESPLVTLGGGHVVQAAAGPIRRRDAAAIVPRLTRLMSADEMTRAGETIYFYGLRGWSPLDLARDAAVEPSQHDGILGALVSRGDVVAIAGGGAQAAHAHRDAVALMEARIASALARLHEETPLEASVPKQRLVQRVSRLGDPALLSAIIERMIAAKTLRGDAQAVALPAFKPKLTAAQQQLLQRMIEAYEKAEFAPPDVGEMAKSVGSNEKEVRMILDLAVKAGKVAHLGGPLYMHTRHEGELRRRAEQALRERGELAMSDLRDLFNTTRKYAVPMGEYLDRVGLTKRRGDLRVLRTAS
jgi:selenocysteine-specific elongation factor